MNNKKNLDKRFWEIDFFRGLALLGMIIYHLFYDLNYFNAIKINIRGFNWQIFAHIVAFSFILISGIALSLSSTRARLKNDSSFLKKYFFRGTKVFSLGLVISVVTWVFFPDEFILFGVLHYIGVSIVLAIPFLNKSYLNLFLAILVSYIGLIISQIRVNFPHLIWIGLKPENFYSLDYFPIFPWFAVTLLGIGFGNLFYPSYKRILELPDLSYYWIVKKIEFLGKNSLVIYFFHQPVIVSILVFLGMIDLNNLIFVI